MNLPKLALKGAVMVSSMLALGAVIKLEDKMQDRIDDRYSKDEEKESTDS